MLALGPTMAGKSHWVRGIFCSRHIAAHARLVVDPVGSDLTAVPGAVTFWEPAQLPAMPDGRPPTWRFVPRDPYDVDAYGELHATVEGAILDGRLSAVWEWADETAIIMPSGSGRPEPRSAVLRGAKLAWGWAGTTTRMAGTDPVARENAELIAVFGALGDPDMKVLAAEMRIRLDDLYEMLAGLPRHGYVAWRRSLNHVWVIEP